VRPFKVGDGVLVLRWLLSGDQGGPYSLTEVASEGRYVVSYGHLRSYAEELPGSELVHYTDEIRAELPDLLARRAAGHALADEEFRARLRQFCAESDP